MSARVWWLRNHRPFEPPALWGPTRHKRVGRLMRLQDRDGVLGWYKGRLRQISQHPKPPAPVKRSRP